MAIQLIVNADDFGLSPGVNQGIIECFEKGIVTSTSLMVRQPAAAAAAIYARQNPRLDVGLHLDLGEWVFRDYTWQARYQVVDMDDAAAMHQEVERQLTEFRRLVGRDPTHLDSHQHAHRKVTAQIAAKALAESLGVVLRGHHPAVRFCGHFYGQDTDGQPQPEAISVPALTKILDGLPEGITELCCHPGYADDLESAYRQEREKEIQVLCDPAIRRLLMQKNITLTAFNELFANRVE